MKIFGKILAGMLIIQSTAAFSAQWYGFCYGKAAGKTYCSAIQEKTPDFSLVCKSWSTSHGYGVWGNQTGTSVPALLSKQASKCDEVEGGGGTPGTNFACYAEVLCPGPGDTSSIHLDPLGVNVMAPSFDEASKKCLMENPAAYAELLKQTTTSNCYLKVKATDI